MILVFAAAIANPLTLVAMENEDARAYQFERYIVMFYAAEGGEFPASEAAGGIRFVPIGDTLTRDQFPPNPTRYGYVFDGWRFRDSGAMLDRDYIVVNSNINLDAVWIRYGDTPTQTPGPSPTPGASPSPTPAPGASPSPAPTATPNKDAARPNPGTNPIAISFLIFGAVIGLGFASFGIIKITARHFSAAGQYRIDETRYKRENRLTNFLEDDTE